MRGPGLDALGGLGGDLSHRPEVMGKGLRCHLLPSLPRPVPGLHPPHCSTSLEREDMSCAPPQRGCKVQDWSLKPNIQARMEDTGGGSPGFKRGNGNVMPSLPACGLWQISHALGLLVRLIAAAGLGARQGWVGW